ncbi:MAG TPA: ankyrin repeat domain-containing protein [Nitrospirota bacterium]|nr:ankyrin repeat domain-containing protein [Nitrospirota bacterium]
MRSIIKLFFGLLMPTMVICGCSSPLIKAAQTGDLMATKQLIRDGVNINAVNSSGESALVIAAKSGNLDMARTLIKAGAEVNQRTNSKDTALTIAACKCHPEIIALLLENGADPNVQNEDFKSTPLNLLAGYCNNSDSVKALLSKGANPKLGNRCGDTPLITAAGNGYSEIVSILLDTNVNIDETGCRMQTALFRAAREGQVKTLELLIRRGADINHEAESQWCSGPVCLEPQRNWTPLMIAAANGRADAVDLLLSKGVDPNATNSYSQTAIILAAQEGHARIVESLLKKGANPNIIPSDKNGHPALVSAVIRNYRLVVETLIKYGADINIKSRDGKTPLTFAKINRRNEMQQLLQDHGAKE